MPQNENKTRLGMVIGNPDDFKKATAGGLGGLLSLIKQTKDRQDETPDPLRMLENLQISELRKADALRADNAQGVQQSQTNINELGSLLSKVGGRAAAETAAARRASTPARAAAPTPATASAATIKAMRERLRKMAEAGDAAGLATLQGELGSLVESEVDQSLLQQLKILQSEVTRRARDAARSGG